MTDETPTETYARRRRMMIDVERGRVLEARSTGTVPHEVVAQVLAMLDVEESMLDYSQRERGRLRGVGHAAGAGRRLRAPGGDPPTVVAADARASAPTASARAPRGCTCGCA